MKLYEFLAYDRDRFIKYLSDDVGALPRRRQCPQCGATIHRREDKNLLFRCRRINKRTRARCTFVQSARTNTWFAQSRLSIETICRFAAYFAKLNTSPRQLFLQNEFSLSSKTAPRWISRCRKVCLRWCRNNAKDLVLGGPGRIVEIDEAKFGHRKYHRGRIIEGKWLFGGYERDSGRLFIIPVVDRTTSTLIPLIRRYIAPGSTIISDCWRSYETLNTYHDYTYLRVNHSINFVDPNTGAHTQNIERVWRDIRYALPRFGGVRENTMEYLAEYVFRREVPLSLRIEYFFATAAGRTTTTDGSDDDDDDDDELVGVFSNKRSFLQNELTFKKSRLFDAEFVVVDESETEDDK